MGVLAATVVQPHARERIDPLKIVPPQFRPRAERRPKTKAQIDRESNKAWKLMRQAWGKGRKKEWRVSVVQRVPAEPSGPSSDPDASR